MVIGGLDGCDCEVCLDKTMVQRILIGLKKGYEWQYIAWDCFTPLLTTVLFLVFPKSLARCFVTDRQTIEITANYLRIVELQLKSLWQLKLFLMEPLWD